MDKEYLVEVFPNIYCTSLAIQIPALPKKKASKKSAEDIEKRMKILAYFLNDIVRLPEVLSLRFLQGFLSI